MAVRANKPAFNIREKLKELTHSVGLKGRELMRAATVQEARDLISAGRKNMVINGKFEVDQRGNTGTVGSGHQYHTDRFIVRNSSSGVISAQTSANASSNAPGFRNWFQVECDGTDGAPSGGEYVRIQHRVEGYNCFMDWGLSGGNKDYITASFWVKSNQTGIHCVSIEDGDTLPVHVKEYNIDTADTWQKISVTFPPPSSGSFRSRDGETGLTITWCLMSGTDYQTSPDTWVSTYEMATSNMVNFMNNSNNYFYITGVQLEVGKNATDFEHRPYGEELALCQRYYYRIYNGTQRNNTRFAIGSAVSSGDLDFIFDLPVTMRSVPTIDKQAVGNYRTPSGPSGPITSFTNLDMAHATESVACVRATKSGAYTTGTSYILSPNGSGADNDRYIGFNAEL